MPKVSPIQNSFNAGELSPLLAGRTDLDRYKAGLAVCENYVPALQGPLIRRPGTKYVGETKHYNRDAILIPFKYSREDSYIIEYGTSDAAGNHADYFRFYKDGGLVTEADKTITSVTSGASVGSPLTITAASHGYADGDRVVITGTGLHLDNREFIVATVSANLFTVKDAQTSTTAVGLGTSGSVGTVAKVYEVAGLTSTSSPTLNLYQFAQSGDVLYLVGPERPPVTISRFADASWTYGALRHNDGPYLDLNDTTTTLNVLGAVTGAITITASVATGINNGQGFRSVDDIGRIIRIKHGSTWGHATVTGVNSTVSVGATTGADFGATGTSTEWRLSSWARFENPVAVCFYENRLAFGGGIDSQQVALSASDDYTNFSPTNASGGTTATGAITLSPNANEANAIQWLAQDEKGLIAGTKGGPWVVKAAQNGEPLDATSNSIKKASSYGSSGVQPAQVDKATLYIQNSGKKVREFLYFYDVDGFRSSDLTVLSEHIAQSGIARICHQKEPQPILWGMREDGQLIGLTYERDIDNLKAGWHRHPLGGYSNASQTADPLVKSIAVIPDTNGVNEELWMVTERYINGRVRRHVEYLTPFYDNDTSLTDAFFVDSGLSYDNDATATLSVSGLAHLAGQVVSVLANGIVQPDKTVSTDTFAISLDSSATKVHVGLAYESKGQLMRLDAGAADGTALGKTRRMHRVGMVLDKMGGLSIGMDFTNMQEVSFVDGTMTFGSAVALYTGIRSFEVEAGYDFENQFCWKQDKPLPGTVVAILPQMYTQDR